jgi:hypothetical protein
VAATVATDVQQWVDTFRRENDSAPAIQSHGKYFTCAYMLDMEHHNFVIHMHDGKIDNIFVDPGPLDERYQFAIRASADTWRKFAQDPPPPMYHGIWAATFRTDMTLEGDMLILMQNLRNITIQLELLRKTGVPV